MKLKISHLLFVPVAIFCSQAFAAENCKNPESQLAMNVCAAKDYEREDARLNKTYNELVGNLSAERKGQLKEVQLTWIKFRDLQCDFDSFESKGGTIYSLVRSSCLTQMSKQRTKDLKAMLEDVSR